LPTALAMVEADWRRPTEPLSLEVGTYFQIGVNRGGQAKSEVWVLAVAESASTTFCSIVGGLAGWVMKKCAEPCEVVSVQVLLLAA
jgi:hypothetical protein